jgi:hypothetical protein
MGALEFVIFCPNSDLVVAVLNAVVARKRFVSDSKRIKMKFAEAIEKIVQIKPWAIQVILLQLVSRIAWSDKLYPSFADTLFDYVSGIASKWGSRTGLNSVAASDEPLFIHARQTLEEINSLAKPTETYDLNAIQLDLATIENGINRILMERIRDLSITTRTT